MVGPAPADAPVPAAIINPLWQSLAGGHAGLAIGGDRARRYPAAIAAFAALADPSDPADWAELVTLLQPGEIVAVGGPEVTVPAGWEQLIAYDGVQMVATDAFETADDPELIELGAADAPK